MLLTKRELQQLDQDNNKIKYARITSLRFSDEFPLEQIEGKVTQGSINIDGSSVIRHSCSLTIVAKDFNYSNYLWSYKTKFRLEIGLWDRTKQTIVWFDQGIYLITSFNTARSTNNFTINITGKDKMCLLNGEMSGVLQATTDFGTIEEEDSEGNWQIRKLPLKDIIRNMVHQYGGEPFHNIIVQDLDTYGLELMEYRYNVPMYLYGAKKEYSDIIEYENMFTEDLDLEFYIDCDKKITLKEINERADEFLVPMINELNISTNISPVGFDNNNIKYYLTKIESGQTCGYQVTELVYAGDLIGKIGENITTILDKIKNMLVEFEYFYNTEGQFVFRKKLSTLNTMWNFSNDEENPDAVPVEEDYYYSASTMYELNSYNLISAFNANPNIQNVKNDFSIWGKRVTASGATIPIHLRYAIDEKPNKYYTINVSEKDIQEYNKKYGTQLQPQSSKKYEVGKYSEGKWDWRELIYIMAKDYFAYSWMDDFELRLIQANTEYSTEEVNYLYPSGRTGYEQYYTDIQGFWRQLYFPPALKEQRKSEINKIQEQLIEELELIQRSIDENQIQCEYLESLSQIDTTVEFELKQRKEALQIQQNLYQEKDNELNNLNEELINLDNYDEEGWHDNIKNAPDLLNFWFDFLDADIDISQYGVKSIGQKNKAIDEDTIKAIYFRDIPNIIYINETQNLIDTSDPTLGEFSFINILNIANRFSISAQGKSAKERLDELLNLHTNCAETVNITTVPIYHLKPNTRIHLQDKDTALSGDYIINKITIPLVYNGTMSITASKAYQSIVY